MTAIDSTIEELKAEIAAVEPIRDGWVYLDRAITVRGDGAGASFQCHRAVLAYDERLRLLHLAWATLEELKADGYPGRIPLVMRPDIAGVIEGSGTNIMAAIGTVYGDKEAASADIELGTPISRKD